MNPLITPEPNAEFLNLSPMLPSTPFPPPAALPSLSFKPCIKFESMILLKTFLIPSVIVLPKLTTVFATVFTALPKPDFDISVAIFFNDFARIFPGFFMRSPTVAVFVITRFPLASLLILPFSSRSH